MRLSEHTVSRGEGLIAFTVLLALIMILQILAGVYASGFGGNGKEDELPNLVTSLMVRDFLAGLDFRHPWQFAQQFYYHYPEVAIGVWPPLFYGALGTWFLIVGASRDAGIMFIAIIAAGTASVIYVTGKRLIGRWAGVLAAVLFAASPLVQESSAGVLSEHLTTLGMLVSTLCFAQFARTGKVAHGLAFGTVAAVAILTHGPAWALGLVPGVTLALTGRWYLLRRLGLWLAAVPVLVTCVPWYVFVFALGIYELVGYGPSGYGVSRVVEAVSSLAWIVYSSVGAPVVIFALVGVWKTLIRVKPRTEVMPEWAALAGLAIATFILYCVLPVTFESRYMVPVVPSVVLLSAAGVNEIAHRLGARLPIGIVRAGLAVMLIAAFSMGSFALPPPQVKNGGYEALVRDVMARVLNVPQIWLISSGAAGEGCLVLAVALQEAHPISYVLRAKTILAGGDWIWRNQTDRFNTLEKLTALLDELPVTIIVIDDQIPPSQYRPYQDRIRQLVASESDKWELIGSHPQTQSGAVFPNSLHVYARRPVASLTIAAPAIRLDQLRALMVRNVLR